MIVVEKVQRDNVPWVLDNPQGDPVLGAELLQLRHHAIGDVRDTLGVEGVHHVLDNVHLVLDREVDEVGIDENVEGRAELGVVLEEQGAGALHVLGGLDLIWVLDDEKVNTMKRRRKR